MGSGREGGRSTALLPCQRLTKRVIEKLGRLVIAVPVALAAVAMAEQEEDFSSLPLPDRFQHKVRSHHPALSQAEHLMAWLLDMESSKSCV
jgi:hypothetical protein